MLERSALRFVMPLCLSASAFAIILAFVACDTRDQTHIPGAIVTIDALFPLTIRDSSGGAVIFTAPPERVVSLSPAQTETLFALGAGAHVVGRDSFSDYPQEAHEVPVVGDAFALDLEMLATLQATMVYIDFEPGNTGIAQLGTKVLYLDPPRDIDGVLERILLLGRLLDRLPAALAIVEEIRQQVREVEQRIQDVEEGPTVYYELDPGRFTVGSGTFIDDMLRRLKMRNIAASSHGSYPQLANEFIIEQDPQVILFADSVVYGNGEETVDGIGSRAGWGSIIAVKTGRVHAVDADLVSRPGPRIAQGIEHLARLLYPEQFQ